MVPLSPASFAVEVNEDTNILLGGEELPAGAADLKTTSAEEAVSSEGLVDQKAGAPRPVTAFSRPGPAGLRKGSTGAA
jgi:hypothetical protein